jgi:hypothetical protein
MALASVGGGYQTTDGNISELTLGVQAAPQTATATATLTVAQITGGLLVADPSGSAASYTLPTTVATEAVVTNAKVDSTFELNIVNLGYFQWRSYDCRWYGLDACWFGYGRRYVFSPLFGS